jgi:transcriptional regulator with XRE-family HTH domain
VSICAYTYDAARPSLTPYVIALRKAREAAGLTQAELAEVIGVRQATISDLETGKSRRIGLDLLGMLCEVLDVEPSDLIVREPARKRS